MSEPESNLGIPLRHLSRMDQLEPCEAWGKRFHEIMDLHGTGYTLVLSGLRGNGKTQLACAVMWWLWKRHKLPSRYIKTMKFFMLIRSAFSSHSGPTEDDIIQKFSSYRMLVLDEIGERGGSPWEDRTLTHLIDERYDQLKDTILITNQTPKEVESQLGASIISRICESGGIINCDWPSFRASPTLPRLKADLDAERRAEDLRLLRECM